MTYQLSCRKCNKHLTFIGSTDKDLKSTMDDHFSEVVRLVKSKGKSKGDEVVREDAAFARHIARHVKPSFLKKVPSDKYIIEYCQENVKVEVLANNRSMRRLSLDETAQSIRNLCLNTGH